MPRRQGALIALGSLLLVYGLGAGVMAAGGAVLHAIDPTRAVDAFAALHDRWVVGILVGIGALWLLPPYPWASHVVAAPSTTASRPAGTDAADHAEHAGVLAREERPGAVPGPGPKGGAATAQT